MTFALTFVFLFNSLSAKSDAARPVNDYGLKLLASAVLPGSGQMLSGARGRGEAMMWLDGTFWLCWAGLSWYRSNKEQDAKLVAKEFAHANTSIADPKYYRALERYRSSEEFNEDVRREAREIYPDDPDAQRRYYESRAYFGEAAWRWSSDSIRIYSYWQTRKTVRSIGMAASFLSAALVLNRLISFVDYLFFAPDAKFLGRIECKPTQNSTGLELRYRL